MVEADGRLANQLRIFAERDIVACVHAPPISILSSSAVTERLGVRHDPSERDWDGRLFRWWVRLRQRWFHHTFGIVRGCSYFLDFVSVRVLLPLGASILEDE
jgi:hypothetical protein